MNIAGGAPAHLQNFTQFSKQTSACTGTSSAVSTNTSGDFTTDTQVTPAPNKCQFSMSSNCKNWSERSNSQRRCAFSRLHNRERKLWQLHVDYPLMGTDFKLMSSSCSIFHIHIERNLPQLGCNCRSAAEVISVQGAFKNLNLILVYFELLSTWNLNAEIGLPCGFTTNASGSMWKQQAVSKKHEENNA